MMLPQAIAIDVETTGLFAIHGGRIIEIGAVAVDESGITNEFHALVDPGVRIAAQARRVHGIKNAMLAGKPKPEAVLHDLFQYIAGSVLVAHNASFDITFLYEVSPRVSARSARRE